MINHIYVFGPPGTDKTRQIVQENAEKFETTWNEEWLRLVHGLFDEMENPFLTRNVVQTLSEDSLKARHKWMCVATPKYSKVSPIPLWNSRCLTTVGRYTRH